jgi:type II secretory pathway pseudopilin PulG
MSDAVLAAIIAATATLCASFMQLRATLAKEADARSRGQPISRRRSRLPMILIAVMLLASAVGGFALSQWLGGSQRTAQADLERELRERVAEISAAAARLERLAAASAPAQAEPQDPQAAAAAPFAADAATSPATVPTPAPAPPAAAVPTAAAAPPVDAGSLVAQGPAVAGAP